MNWNDLLALEPKLHALPSVAELAGKLDDGNNDCWYLYVKHLFLPLIGFGRDPPGYVARPLPDIFSANHPDFEWNNIEHRRLISLEPVELRCLYTSEAYDVVYDHLLEIYQRFQDEAEEERPQKES